LEKEVKGVPRAVFSGASKAVLYIKIC